MATIQFNRDSAKSIIVKHLKSIKPEALSVTALSKLVGYNGKSQNVANLLAALSDAATLTETTVGNSVRYAYGSMIQETPELTDSAIPVVTDGYMGFKIKKTKSGGHSVTTPENKTITLKKKEVLLVFNNSSAYVVESAGEFAASLKEAVDTYINTEVARGSISGGAANSFVVTEMASGVALDSNATGIDPARVVLFFTVNRHNKAGIVA